MSEFTELQKERELKLRAITRPIECFEVEGVIYRGNREAYIKQFLIANPVELADWAVWCDKNCAVLVPLKKNSW